MKIFLKYMLITIIVAACLPFEMYLIGLAVLDETNFLRDLSEYQIYIASYVSLVLLVGFKISVLLALLNPGK